jgi:drug/metabolite transporter (DMT)-like permease
MTSGILLSGTCIGVVAWAEQHIASAVAALLFATMPLWTVILEWLWPGGKRPGGWVVAGLVLGMTGVGVLVGREAVGSMQGRGALVILGGALSWGTGSVYASRAKLPESLLMTVGMQMSIGGAVVLVASGLLGEWRTFSLDQVTSRSWWAIGYLIVCDSVVAYSAFMWLVRNTSPAVSATFAFVNPVVAVFLGWWIAGDPVTVRTLVAAGTILAAVVLIALRKGSSGASTP